MGAVVSIDSPVQKVNDGPDPERVKFVAFMARIAESYLNGDIDVVMLGYCDQDGRPFPGIGTFPVGLENDVIALGACLEREGTKAVLDFYDEGKESS